MSAATAPQQAPAWLHSLLYMASQRLAMLGVQACEFKSHAGTDEEATYRASLQLDPQSTLATVYVHHVATGICVCRSVPAIVDQLDEVNWETCLHNSLEVSAPRSARAASGKTAAVGEGQRCAE